MHLHDQKIFNEWNFLWGLVELRFTPGNRRGRNSEDSNMGRRRKWFCCFRFSRYCEDSLRCLKHDTNMVLQNSQHYVSALKSLEEATTLAQQTGNNSMTVVLLDNPRASDVRLVDKLAERTVHGCLC